jgi:O-antigen/teichoic acid export membrane protein
VSVTATAPPPAPSARRALGISFRTSLLLQVIASASGIELARGLGVTDRGELAAAMLWPMLLGLIGTLGLEESVTYHVAREPERTGRWVGSAIALGVVQSLVCAVIAAAVVPFAIGRHGSEVVVTSLLFIAYIPGYVLSTGLNGTLNGLHRYSAFHGARLLIAVMILTVQTILLVTGTLTVRSAAVAFAICTVVIAVIVFVMVRRAAGQPLSADRATMREIFAYGVRSHASTTPALLNGRADQLVIAAFLSARDLSLYVIAVTLTSLTALVGGTVAYAALPNVTSLPPGSERALLARRLVGLTLVTSAVVAAPILVGAPLLIDILFGPAFGPATTVTRVLVVGVIALSTNRALEAVLRAVGRPLDAGISELVALGVTAVALAVLLPLFGLIGAAIASLLAYATTTAWMTRRASRALEVPASQLLVPSREDLAAGRDIALALVRRIRR